MKWLSHIKNIITGLLFVLIVILGGLIFLSGRSDIQGWRILIVKSGSMEPTIKTGSVIAVQKQSDYQKGDVVTFGPTTRPELLITHRIIDVTEKNGEKYIQTKGDFNASADQELTPMKAVVARHRFSVPYIGYLIGFAQTQLGVVVLIVIPGTILIYDELMNLKKAFVELFMKFGKKAKTEKQEKEESA